MSAFTSVNKFSPDIMDLHYDPPQINKIVEIRPYNQTHNLQKIIYLDAVNAYLLVSEDGTLSLLDGSFEATADRVCSFNQHIQVSYATINGSLILINDRKISIRRDHRGVHSMNTAFDSVEDGRSRLEIPLDEATEWSAYFATRQDDEFQDKPIFLKFGQLIDEALASHDSEKACVVIEIDLLRLWNELNSLTNTMIELHEITYPIFPYAFGTIERIRLLLYPDKPYTPEKADYCRKCAIPKSVLNSEAARLLTFNRWPHSQYRYAIPSKMAEAGFYHQPNERGEDRVLCFLCNVCLVYWEPSDEPYQEHERHSPSCRFISNMVSSNVPLSLSMSALAPLQLELSDERLNVSSMISSFMTSSTEWFAIASSENSKPVIQLCHLDSITQTPINFTVDLNDPFFAPSFDTSEQPRRPHRVTWQDSTSISILPGESSSRSQRHSSPPSSSDSNQPFIQITALCSMGMSYVRPKGSFIAVGPETSVDSALIVGVGVNEAKVKKKDQHNMEFDSEPNEVNTLNTVNLSTGASLTPRIEASILEASQEHSKRRPFILVYHILRTLISSDTNTEKLKNVQNKSKQEKPRSSSSNKIDLATNTSDMNNTLVKPPEEGLKDAEKKLDEAISEVISICSETAPTEATTPMDYEFVPDASDSPATTLPAGDFYSSSDYANDNYIGEPVAIKSTSVVNPTDSTYIYYEHKETSTVAMQCIRLPEELDSHEFKVEQIVASENGIIAVAVNRIETTSTKNFVSALVIYSCSCGILQRFSDGRVLLVDLHTNRSIKVCDQNAVDITVGDNGTLIVLTDNGAVLSFEIKQSLPRLKSDEDEELAISMLSALSSWNDNILERLADVFQDHPKTKTIMNIVATLPVFQPLSISTLKMLWKLIQADHTPLPSLSSTPNTIGIQNSPSASVLLHASSGFQMQAPAAWVESHLYYRNKKAHSSNTPGTVSSIPNRRDEYPPPTRSWIFSPGVDAILNSYVFEFTFLPGMPISHMNIRLKFLPRASPSSNQFDLKLSILRLLKNHESGEGKSHDSNMTTSQHASSLTYYSENVNALREKCEVVVKETLISDFMDSTNLSSTIQIPGTILLKSMAGSIQNETKPVGWMTVSQTFYLVIETSSQVIQDTKGFIKASTIPTSKSEKTKKPTAIMILKKNQPENSTASGDFSNPSLNKLDDVVNVMQLIEELSVTIYRTRSASQACEKLQRLVLTERSKLHEELLRLASLSISPDALSGEIAQILRDRWRLIENQALDILIWLISDISPQNFKENIDHLAQLSGHIIDTFDNIYVNGYESASRLVSHKWTIFLTEFIRILQATDVKICEKLVLSLLKSVKTIIPKIFQIKKAGSVHELFILIFVLIQISSELGDDSLNEATDTVLATCIETLTAIGQAWERKWTNSVYQKLSVYYQLSGFPMDLIMYDWPQQVVSMRMRNSGIGTSAKGTSSNGFPWAKSAATTLPFPSSAYGSYNISTSNNMPFTSTSYQALFPNITAAPTQSSTSGFQPYSAFKANLMFEDANAFPPLDLKSSGKTQASSAAACSASISNTKLNSEMAIDELQWMDLFNIKDLFVTNNISDPGLSSSNKNFTDGWKGFPETNDMPIAPNYNYSDWATKSKDNKFAEVSTETGETRRCVISSEHLYGLLETEPLSFQVVRGSDHMRLHNVENASVSLRVPSDTDNEGTNASANAPTKVSDEKNQLTDRFIDVESKNLAKVYSLKHQLQQHSEMKIEKEQQQPETQASSASTFGVPTTPKTTPFLTPTPLSPINSQSDLTSLDTENEKLSIGNSLHMNAADGASILAQDLFKPPPILVLAVERMTAGSKKFVVLDFGMPILLTDIFIPSCEFTNMVYVDVWNKTEQTGSIENCQRLISSSEIIRKSISLSNITPPLLIRYVKITYVVKQLYNGICQIPLGKFYGTRFFSAWQVYPSILEKSIGFFGQPTEQSEQEKIDCFNKELKKLYSQQVGYLGSLRQLAEDLRCRYQLAVSELNNLLKEDRNAAAVKAIYRQCMSYRLQWNITWNVLQRLESDHSRMGAQEMLSTTISWNDCSLEQLQSISINLFSLLNSVMHLMDIRQLANETEVVSSSSKQPIMSSRLNLETAVQQFGFFCKNSVPTLQTHCCTWLFNQGIQSEWWPNFFPAVLRKHFASRDETSSDRLFLLLSYMCNQSVKFQQNQGRIMEKLLEFLIELLTSDKDADLMKDRLRTSLLPWTLLLISAAFDVIVANKRRSDRWTFLAGEFAIFSSSSISQYNENAKEVLSKHHPLYKLATTKSSVAKAYMKKYADKIDSLMNKPIPPEEKLHELQARLKCLYQIYNGLTQEVEGSQPASSSNDKAPPIVSFEEITGLLDESESKPSSSAPSTSSVQSTLKPSAIAKETTKKIKIGKLGPPSSSTVNVATFATGLKRRVPPVLPKPAKDSRSGLMASGSRIRQYSVRLKLNFSLCTEVVNKLFQLLCHDSITLSSPAQLLACKIIAKIGVHACTFPIPLKVIVDSNLKTLIYNAFNNTENIWFRHAVLCMILDLTDAEIRAISRVTSNLNASASTSALSSEPGTTGSGRGVPITAELTASSSTENMDTSESLPVTTQASAELQIATKRHKSEQDLLLLDQPQTSTSALELNTEGSRDLSNIKPTDSRLIDSFQKSKFKQIMASYKAMSDDIYMQPISNVTEGHASEQLGLHAYTEYRETVALKDTLARCPPRRAIQQAKVKKPASPEDLALMALIGTSVSTVIDVIKAMIVEINAEMSVNHVERLLAFYWDYISNVNATLASNKCVTQITIPPFTAMAADSLIKYLTTAPMLNEQVWRLILQTLDSSLRKSPELVPNIIDSVYLLPLMERFMGDSLNKTGNFAFGCAVNKAYMRFIDQLLNYQATETETKFGEKIVASLISVFSLNGPYKFAPYPLDILLEITDKLAADPAKFFSPDSCGDNTIVDLFESVVKFAKTFLSTVDKSARKICDDRYGFTTPVRPNVCFSSFSPSMTPTETPNQPPGLAPPGFSCSKVPVSSTNLIDSEEVMASSNNLSEVECPMPDIPVQQDSMATVDATSNSLEYDSISSVNDFPYIDDVEIFEDDGFDEVINLDRFVKTYQNPNDRIHLDRHETLLSSLFKILGSSMAMSSRNAIKILLTEKPNVVYDLFEILFTCDASTKSVEEISTEHWKVATVGDHILYALLSISNYAGVDGELSKLLLSAFLDFITRRTKNYGDRLYSSESMRPLELTIPVVYYLSKLLQPLCRKKLFAELGGHIFVSSQLEKGLDASTENWPIGASLTPLARQLAEISNKMTGIELPSIPYPPRATEARFEGLYNFAPLCSATSTSPLAHHLNNLLSASAPHRRARTPIWSYHFPPSQQWLEITLTLPYQVLLSEVNLKAHSQSLGTCPSAIQVEICSEPSLANWLVVGSPMATFGLNRISIPITYSTPINAVRIHLKKPPNSETMSLSQLMLLGVSTKANLHENNNSTTVLINWLAVFNRTLVVEPTVWSYAPSLPEKLAQLFVNRPLPNEVMLSMSQTLTNIDNKAKSGATTIVGLIINYLANSGYVCHTAHSWLVELFFKYCTLTNVPGVSQNTSQSMAVIRQRQLLEGIVILLDRRNSGSINLNEKTLSSLIWAAACIIWYNLNEEFMRYETIAAVLEVGPKTIDLLLKLALESQSSMLKKSACWLLCSFIRSSRSFMEPILQKLKISTILTSEPSPATLTALGMIAQSGNATFYLHEKNILSDLAQLSIMICKDKMLSKIELLVALVEFFSSLVVIERVRQFLETPLGLEFVRVLMLFIIENSHSILSSINNHMSQLGSYFIELITKCRTHSEIQRQNIAKIMCNLLEYLPSQDFKNTTGLNGALQQMVMKFILEDEHITVRFTDVIDSTATGEIFEEKMRHPMFGCNRNDRVVDLSIYTTCKDLLPVQKRESNMNPSPMPSGNPNVYYANSYSDEVGDSYDAYGFPIYYSKPKQKKKAITSSDQLDTNFITQLLCDNISQRQPLDGECTLEQILQVSKSLSALSSSLGRDHSRFLSNSFAAKPGTSSSSTSSSDLSPHDDGYFALTLRIKSLNIQELNQEATSTLFKGGKVSSVSTLQYFARSGGLSILAQHLPVYQHYIQLLLKCDEISNQLNEHKEKQQRQAQPTTAAAAQQQLKSKAPLGFVSSANQSSSGWVNSTAYIPPSSAATEVEIYDPESWNEFIAEPGNIATSSSYVGGGGSGGVFNIDLLFGSTSKSQTSSAFQPTAIPTISSQVQPSSSEVKTAISSDPNSGLKYKWTTVGGTSSSFLLDDYDFTEVPSIPANNVVFSASASTAAFNPPSGLLHYLTQQMPVNKDAFANKLLTTAIAKTDSIPPHVIIALSIFLRLEGYPELFVTCENRVHAKKLLRVAMGLPSSERSPSDSIAGLRPITKSTIFDTTIMVNPKTTVVPSFSPACLHPAVMAKQSIDSEEFSKSNEDEVLALFPFFVLEKLLQYSSPYQIGLQRAQSIRDLALRLGVLDVILLCLSHFAHQESRFETLRPDSMDPPLECVQMIRQALNMSSHLEALKNACDAYVAQNQSSRYHSMFGINGPQNASQAQQDFWVKGTGFGSGTTQQQWNVNQHVAKRRQDEATTRSLLNTIAFFINPKPDPDSTVVPAFDPKNQIELDVRLIQLLNRSCLLKTIHSYLMNDSVLDMSKHADSQLAAITVVLAMATAPPVMGSASILYGGETEPEMEHDGAKIDLFALLLRDTHFGQTLLSGLQKIGKLIDVYLSKLQKEKKTDKENVSPTTVDSEQEEGEENLYKLSQLVKETSVAVLKRLGEFEQAHTEPVAGPSSRVAGATDELYIESMKPLQFESIPFFEKDGKTLKIPYHYSNSISSAVGQTANLGKRTRRLAQEIVTLSTSLPLSLSSSVFIRASEERLDIMKVLIMGPESTAYSNGCFEFDVWFPANYPNEPMQVNLETTGNQSVRFNPNLYNDGKVCLSILNTWHGRPEERWQPSTSSLLQVIVSIQSLIMVPESFFNEPGYERQRNTPAGIQQAREYDANIRHNTIRWAMVEALRHPPKAFEEVIRRHFWLKRDEICSQITEWINETQTHISDQEENSKTQLNNHLASLKKNFELLKQEFAKMKCPEGLEHVQSAFMEESTKETSSTVTDTSETSTEPAAPTETVTETNPEVVLW